MMDPQFSITGASGVTIPLVSTPDGTGPYRLRSGTRGLGAPLEGIRFSESAAGGGYYRGHRTLMREGTLVIETTGRSRADTEAKLRTLLDVLAADNQPRLVAAYPGGYTWSIGFFVEGGWDDSYQEWGDTTVEWPLEVRFPRPHWVREQPVQFGVESSLDEVEGLLPDLAELPVMDSQAYGSLTVTNPGDVPAPVSWRIVGPGGPVHVALGGRGFTLNRVLEDGEVVTVERTPRGWRVLGQDGTSLYPSLGPAPKFPSAPKGTAPGTIVIENPTPGKSAVRGWFSPLRKLVM